MRVKKKDTAARPRDEGDDSKESPNNGESDGIVYKTYDFSTPISTESDEDTAPFPLDVFPDALKAPVEEMVRHYKVKAALPAMVALCVNSAAIGRGVIVMSNVRRTYANIYALLAQKAALVKASCTRISPKLCWTHKTKSWNGFSNRKSLAWKLNSSFWNAMSKI